MIEKIISGGQTGADRAALDCAIEHGIPHGGWCPKGRLAEDCPIDARYQLQETPGSSYLQRTEWNVRDTDGTVIFSITPGLSGGSKKTLDLAKKRNKPVLHLSRHGGPASPETELLRFIRANRIMVLNVAGPRASKGSLTRCLKPSVRPPRWGDADSGGNTQGGGPKRPGKSRVDQTNVTIKPPTECDCSLFKLPVLAHVRAAADTCWACTLITSCRTTDLFDAQWLLLTLDPIKAGRPHYRSIRVGGRWASRGNCAPDGRDLGG